MEKKIYDAEFKREAIRLVEEQREKPAAVAKKLGVTKRRPSLQNAKDEIQIHV